MHGRRNTKCVVERERTHEMRCLSIEGVALKLARKLCGTTSARGFENAWVMVGSCSDKDKNYPSVMIRFFPVALKCTYRGRHSTLGASMHKLWSWKMRTGDCVVKLGHLYTVLCKMHEQCVLPMRQLTVVPSHSLHWSDPILSKHIAARPGSGPKKA